MRYSSFLTLQSKQFFNPVCDVADETGEYWKRFIPHETFEVDLLDKVVKGAYSAEPKEKKSVWVRGTFGTGKSHAAAVVKHLLADTLENIEPWVRESISAQLAQRLLRQKEKFGNYLPVVINGAGIISDSQTFLWKLQISIIEAVERHGFSLDLSVDFDTYLDMLNESTIDWQALIDNDDELFAYARDVADIRSHLVNKDISFLSTLSRACKARRIHFSLSDTELTNWLKQAVGKVQEQGYAGIVVIWDEFTSVMENSNAGIVNLVQTIAQLTPNCNFLLYLISHKVGDDRNYAQEEYKKLSDRFHIVTYNMQTTTTYHILAKTIKETDPVLAAECRNAAFRRANISFIANQLAFGETRSSVAKEELLKLYPLHPYTAYLGTMMSRLLYSASRSIFKFLYDGEKGFLAFLEKDEEEESACTAESLWDFFVEDFREKDENSAIMACYQRGIDAVSKMGKAHLNVFKSILLLNVLSRKMTSGAGYATPSGEHIEMMFAGKYDSDAIKGVLEYLGGKYIPRDPNGNYVVDTTSLPGVDVERIKNAIRSKGIDLNSTVFCSDKYQIEGWFKGIPRAKSIYLIDGDFSNPNKCTHLRDLVQKVKEDYRVHLMLIFCRNFDQIEKVNSVIKESFNKGLIKSNCIPVVFTTVLGDVEEEQYFTYLAKAKAAEQLSLKVEAKQYGDSARKLLSNWLSSVHAGQCQIHLSSESVEYQVVTNAASIIQRDVVSQVFSAGFDSHMPNQQVWDVVNAKMLVERVLTVRSNSALLALKGTDSMLKSAFLDSKGNQILDNDTLKFLPSCPEQHPLKVIAETVWSQIDRQKSKSEFNLASVLQHVLTKAPFGLYKCRVHQAALALAMSKYKEGVLYATATGQPIGIIDMKDVVSSVFAYWEGDRNSNVFLRFGSKEESECRKSLVSIFSLEDTANTKAVIESIRFDFQDAKRAPLWVLLPFNEGEVNDISSAAESLFEFIKKDAPNREDYKKLQQEIGNFVHELKDLVQRTPEEYEIRFRQYLIGIRPDKICDDNVNNLLTCIRQRLQDKVGTWTEEQVKSEALAWIIDVPPPPPPPPTPQTPPTPPSKVDEIVARLEEDDYSEGEILDLVFEILCKDANAVLIVEDFMRKHDAKLRQHN